jgi:recombination protein RecT
MAVAQKPEPTALATTSPAELAETKSFAIALMENYGGRIEALLPEGVSLARVAALLRLEAMKNPQLRECTPGSLIMGVGRILSWQLELGRTAFLLTFKKGRGPDQVTEAVPVMGYLGMAELMVASGAVRAVQARCVYEHETFQYEQGLDPILRHIPIGVPAERGALKGAYCILRIRGGDVFDFMSIEDIDAIRNRHSKQWSQEKVGACPPWYAEKTIVRRTSKLVPKTPRLARALAAIDEDLAIESGEELPLAPSQRIADVPAQPTTRPVATSGAAPYDAGAAVNNAPVPPALNSDDPGFTDDDAPMD